MRLPHFLYALAACTLVAQAHAVSNQLIDVDVIDRVGRSFPTFPVGERHAREERKAFLQAQPGEAYAIRVSNRSGARVGLVIAVDGRNIISGRRSHLRPTEKMYVLEPWQSAVYEGWRTGRNRVNEFFFTSDLDSYAGAFGDFSAMGVVAVAAFEDRLQRYDRRDRRESARKNGDAAAERAAPGTGFGDERHSPSYRVDFSPRSRATAQTFIKYEWRDTLCRMGVTRCGPAQNRFWPDANYRGRNGDRGFAAYPPGYRYRAPAWRARSHRLR